MESAESEQGEFVELSVIENSHSARILAFLLLNGSCMKTDLYSGVARSAMMPVKLDRLEDAGLISQDVHGRRTFIALTPLGREVAEHIVAINRILSGADGGLHIDS